MVRVVVVSYNACDLTLACLRSILATEWPPDRLETVLVDNASTEPVVARVRSELPAVRVITNESNLGFGAANNIALRDRREFDYLALVNNDAAVEPGWLAPLVDRWRRPRARCRLPQVLLGSRFLPVVLRSTTHRRGPR